jgi:ABC-type uncharacterized transport system substrate-binding protein
LKRREFITLLAGATAWPLAANAQQPAIPVIGFLSATSPAETASAVKAFHQGLGETGYVEGKNVTVEYRWAEGRYDRLPALAAELVRRQVSVIAATGGDPSPLAAKAATATIPIVFTIGGDPVEAGLVTSLNRPGGNITGATYMFVEMGPKRLDLARQLVPNAAAVAMLVNPSFPLASAEVRNMLAAGRSRAIKINVLNASSESEIEAAFGTIVQQRPDALVLGTDSFFVGQRDQLARLTARHAVPTIFFLREFVDAGGLMSYGPDIASGYRQAGAIPAAFSMVRSLLLCRYCSQHTSRSPSTLRPRRRSVSRYHRTCSRLPTT